MNEVTKISNITEVLEWMISFRKTLLELLPEVDHAIVNIQYGKNLKKLESHHKTKIYRQHRQNDGSILSDLISSKVSLQPSDRLLLEGQK